MSFDLQAHSFSNICSIWECLGGGGWGVGGGGEEKELKHTDRLVLMPSQPRLG